MQTIEKHGGIWVDSSVEDGWTAYFEKYDLSSDLIGVVSQKRGIFRAVVYEKISGRPQWRLPWWSERRPEALFDSGHEAIKYLEVLIPNGSKKSEKSNEESSKEN